MRQDQIKYARERIIQVRDSKLATAKAACMVKPKTPSDKEKLQAIRNGEVYLRNAPLKADMRLIDAYYFGDLDAKPFLDSDAYDKAAKPIREQSAKILDQLMLGDGEDALKLINNFLK